MPAELWTLEADGYWRSEYRDAYSARDNYEYGTYRPDASTTGILSDRGDLTEVASNYTTLGPNEVIENKWFHGKLTIKHPNTIVRNCLFTADNAGPSSPSYASITAYDDVSSSTLVYDCTFESSTGTVYAKNGIQGRDISVFRCDISGYVDGIGLQGENGRVEGCWIHDLVWFAWDPAQSDGSHNDGIQIHNGTNHVVRGNSIEMGYETTSCVLVAQDGGVATSNVTIDRNWFISTWPTKASACAVGVNISASGLGTAMTGMVLTDNQFSAYGLFSSNHSALITGTTYDLPPTVSGNVNVGTATAAKITRG